MTESTGSVRIDKWLWAARLYKTRSLAAAACDAGHVKCAGVSCKASKPVRGGERIEALTAGGPRIVEVAALSERRGPASEARGLYVDHTPPAPPPDPTLVTRDRGLGRPSKRDRRRLDALRGE